MNRPIPILFYYPYNRGFTGGPRAILNLLGDQLDRTSFRPIFVSQRESPLTERLFERAVETVIVPFPKILDVYNEGILSYSVTDKLRSAKALVDYNRRIEAIGRQYQVCGIWGRNVKSVLLTGIAAHRLGVPLIWDIGVEKDSRGLVKVLHWMGLGMSTVVVTQASGQPENIFGAFTKRVFAAKFMTISPGISPDRVATLRQGRDYDSRSSQEFSILNVGTITPRKNQLMLLRATRDLIKRYPDVRVKFAGSVGDDAYFSRLRKFVQAEGLAPYVTFLGWRDDVPELMHQSDLFVLCSRDEGVPSVIQEAMHAGLPIISTAVGGVPDIIQDGETGFLVPKDNAAQLQAVIEYCLTHPEVRRSVRVRARKIVEQRFSAATWSSKYSDLLRRLCRN